MDNPPERSDAAPTLRHPCLRPGASRRPTARHPALRCHSKHPRPCDRSQFQSKPSRRPQAVLRAESRDFAPSALGRLSAAISVRARKKGFLPGRPLLRPQRGFPEAITVQPSETPGLPSVVCRILRWVSPVSLSGTDPGGTEQLRCGLQYPLGMTNCVPVWVFCHAPR